MKNVVIFRETLLPPSETFIKEQCRSLVAWSPLLLGVASAPRSLSLDGVAHAVIPPRSPSFWQRVSRRLVPAASRPSPELVARAREHQPSLIHAHFGPDGLFAHSLAQTLGVPLLVTLHGYDIHIKPDVWRSGQMGPAMRGYPERLRQLALHQGVHFIAVSESVKKQAVSVYGIPPTSITVSHIGIDTTQFTASTRSMRDRAVTLTYVGRLVEKKGVATLVRAAAIAAKRVPSLRINIIGDGPLAQPMKNLASELGCPAEFLGLQPPSQVAATLRESRLFCLPSVTAENGDAEGFGLVILEAQASGVPAISSARGGATEGILDGETGFAFNEGDHETLADIICSVIEDDVRLERMAKAARSFVVDRFDLTVRTRHLEEIYNRIAHQ